MHNTSHGVIKVHKLWDLITLVKEHPEASEIVLQVLRLQKLGVRNCLVQWTLTTRMFQMMVTLDDGYLKEEMTKIVDASCFQKISKTLSEDLPPPLW